MDEFEEAIKEINILLDKLSNVTFKLEGDSRTIKGREFVWNEYGEYLYILRDELSDAFRKMITNR